MLPKKDVILIKHLVLNKSDEAHKILANLHPADIVQILNEIKNGNKKLFFRMMSSSKAAEVLEEFDPFDRLHIMEEMTERKRKNPRKHVCRRNYRPFSENAYSSG